MNKIRWRILGAICMLLSVILLTTTRQAWASISKQPTSALNLLLQKDVVSQASEPVNMEIIRDLLLQDNDEEKGYQVFLPLVRR